MTTKPFQLIIIGDEILHGSRIDGHFVFFRELLREHGLQLASVQYLPDERAVLVREFQRSFAAGLPAFITGGIGATPDDHTRQAAAQALDLPLLRHIQAAEFIRELSAQRGDVHDSPNAQQRLQMADFPKGADIIPNPYNNIAGFSIAEHYFLPGFPKMAHPMARWVLQKYYAAWFHQTERTQISARLFRLPESVIAPVMADLQARYAGIQTFSLPHLGDEHSAAHIEFGIKAEGAACRLVPQAWQEAQETLRCLGGEWQNLPSV